MKVNVLSISGPCEPGVYAVSRVEVSFDDQNSLTIDKLLVVQNKQGRLCVSVPCPREWDAYGDGPAYTLSSGLTRLIARAVLDGYNAWANQQEGSVEPAWAPAADSDSCVTGD